jgi:polyisoprenoid-binding protein YceI
LGLVLLVALVGVAVLAYVYISGGSGEASQAITAPTLAVNTPADTAPAAEPTAADVSEPTEAAPASDSGGTIFNIVPEESEVRFILSEVLSGQPTIVTGVTNQVAGQLLVDFASPANTQVGTIRINVRTMETDNDFRNRAIRSQILMSARDEFEFAEFMPTALSGLPDQVAVGQPVSFQIIGDLTVKGITNSVTFDATVTPVSEARLEGSASTVVQRAMYEMQIPRVPNVADVSEDVTLELDFVAVAE